MDTVALREGLTRLGLTPTDRQIEQLAAYAALLLRWNKTYNLTAIRHEDEVLTHHLLDSAAMVPHIAVEAPDAKTVLDVGSGGGLPAVPIAVFRPDLQVTAVDAVGKKAAFINQAAIELGLRNLRARHSRVEKLPGTYDVITSRAFATMKDFTTLTASLAHEGTKWLAMKAVHPEDELADLPGHARALKTIKLEVPGLDEARCLVVLTPAD